MTVVTRQRALHEDHPIIRVGDTAWYVPRRDHRDCDVAVPVRLLGSGGRITSERGSPTDAVSVLLLADTQIGDVPLTTGQVHLVPAAQVGPDTLRDDAADSRASGRHRIDPRWALDLYCPVHSYIHRTPLELCTGEPLPAPPLPGDAVRLAAPSPWTPEVVAVGAIGVLDGMVGHPADTASIAFTAHTFRDDHVVSSSGGPATIATPLTQLARTADTTVLTFWEWRDGGPRAHNSVDYELTVRSGTGTQPHKPTHTAARS